jgi:FRG domain-containing protein
MNHGGNRGKAPNETATQPKRQVGLRPHKPGRRVVKGGPGRRTSGKHAATKARGARTSSTRKAGPQETPRGTTRDPLTSSRTLGTMSRKVRPSTWRDLMEMLEADSWNEQLGRYRSPFAFRGHQRIADSLLNRLARLAAGRRDVGHLELHLLRNFRKYAYGQKSTDSIWHWLALGQHRGLPTRLLDWTYSPLVALHFATASLSVEQDGCVWMLNFVEANRFLPPRLTRLMKGEGADTVTVDMLSALAADLRGFDRLSQKPFVVFLDPPSVDPRIVNQCALFSLMSRVDASLDDWVTAHPTLARRVLVPGSLKWEIRDRLDQANITERVLYPGVDGLSRWLTRYYAKKPDRPPRFRLASARRRKGSRDLLESTPSAGPSTMAEDSLERHTGERRR